MCAWCARVPHAGHPRLPLAGCKLLATASCCSSVSADQAKQPAKSIRPNFTAGVSVSLSEFSAPASAFLPMSKAACPRTFVSSSPPLVPYNPATPSHWLALLCFAAAQSSHRCCCARLCLCKRKAEPERANSAAQHPAMERERTRNTRARKSDLVGIPSKSPTPGPFVTRRAQEIQEAERRLRVSRCGKTRRAKKA